MSGRAESKNIIPGRCAVSVGLADMPTPNGWKWSKLGDVARLESGHTPSRKHPEYWDGEFPWIGIKDARAHHGRTIHKTLQTVTQEGLDNSAARLLPPGTICLSRTASVGYTFVLGEEMATSQDFVNWVCSDEIVPEYLMYAFMAEGERLRSFGQGTTHTTIYYPEVKALHVCHPPADEQRRIVARIEELFSRLDAGVAALRHAKAQLQRYRQSVLAAAVTGQLTQALPSRQAGWRDGSFRNISDKRVPESGGQYFTYVLECEDGSLYKGFSKDLYSRINQHLDGQGAKWTREHRPIALIHFEEFQTEKDAVEREKYFKSGSGREWLNEIRIKQKKKHEPASELLDRILEQRREKWTGKFKEPVLGSSNGADLPAAWSRVTVDQLLVEPMCNGLSMKGSDEPPGVPALKLNAMGGETIDYTPRRYLQTDSPKVDRIWIREGDFFVCRGNGSVKLVGRGCRAGTPPDKVIFPDTMIRLRFAKELRDSCWCAAIWNAGALRYEIERRAKTTSGLYKISQGDIASIELPLPPLAEQHQIVAEVEARTTAIDHLEAELDRQITRSNRLRQSTLASAFSGHI